jgi:amino acid adenylation domain-containing protein
MSVDEVTLGTANSTLIDHVAAVLPGSVAVRGPDGILTYGELTVRAECVAQRLRVAGAKPGDLVGLCLQRSASLVVASLAIFKAGCAYVAIDPGYPDERVRWMLDDSGADVVACDASTADMLSSYGDRSTVVLARGGELQDGSLPDSGKSLPRPLLPTDPAYVVYTSGSTGRPKGVLVEHASLANLASWHRDAFALSESDRCSQIASPGFDASIWEIWPCLASGASLHVVPEDVRADPVGLRNWLVEEGITVTFVPTALAEAVMGLAWPEDGALRYLLTGGDTLTRRPPSGLGFTVVNNYGLSETAVVATSGVVAPDEEGLPSIGRPIAGVVAEVVDEQLQPVPPGVPGELVVGGVAVGRGYVNRPELTTERFLLNREGRWYRTGDRVRLRPDGEFEFLGRTDDQLSIRGFRVEPGEVVVALNDHPAIGESIVVGIGSYGADRQLVAYIVASGSNRPQDDELSEFLAGSLPEYLLPSKYLWLDRLPLTANGKVDRDALPIPDAPTVAELRGAQPRTPTEVTIASVVAELLDITEIGMNQNFFLLGGHSMLGAQLIVRLEDLFGVEITLRYLFDHPTLAEIAAHVERQLAAGQAHGPVTG